MRRTGAQIVWEALKREGVEVVFGLPGGAIMATYHPRQEYGIRHVLVRHEQGAAHAADGYARASGRVGVAIATSGRPVSQHQIDSLTNNVPSVLRLYWEDSILPTLYIAYSANRNREIFHFATTSPELASVAGSPSIVPTKSDANLGTTKGLSRITIVRHSQI